MRKIFRFKILLYPFMILLTYYMVFKGVEVEGIGIGSNNGFGKLAFYFSVIVFIIYIFRKIFSSRKLEFLEGGLFFVTIVLLGIGSGVDYFNVTFFEEYKSFFVIYIVFFLVLTILINLKNVFRKKNVYYDEIKELLKYKLNTFEWDEELDDYDEKYEEFFEGLKDFHVDFVLGRCFNGKEYSYYVLTFNNNNNVGVYLYDIYYNSLTRKKILTIEDLKKKIKRGPFSLCINDVLFGKMLIIKEYEYDKFIEFLDNNYI